MSYLSVAQLCLLALSPLIVPVLVTVVHAVTTWRRRPGQPGRRQPAAHAHDVGLRPVQLFLVEP
jgi:hypothetical protein